MTPVRLLKLLAAISGVLVVLWLGYLYFQVPHRRAPFAKAAAQADRIVLQQGPLTVTLVKNGKEWNLITWANRAVPADPNRVKTLVSGLGDVQLDDVISDRAHRAVDFEVNRESGTEVMLSAGTKSLADGIFGKQAPDFTHIYFRFPKENLIYLARGLIRDELGNVNPNSWRSRDLINLPDPEIQSILVQAPGQSMDLERSSDTWTLNGQKTDPSPVYGLVGTLAHLKADDFVDVSTSTPMTLEMLNWGTITVKSASQTVTLHLGAEDKAKKRYPAAVVKDSLVWLSEAKVQSLFPKLSALPAK